MQTQKVSHSLLPSHFYLFTFCEHKLSWDVHLASLEAFKVSVYDCMEVSLIVGGDKSTEVME